MAKATRSRKLADSEQVNGTATDGPPAKKVKSDIEVSKLEGQEHHDRFLAAYRCLIADLCQQFGGGHPG